MSLQLEKLFKQFNRLQNIHGDKSLMPIYGAGCIHEPKLFLIFMNPTRRNVASSKEWSGIRAPWIGTKNIWKLFFRLGLIDQKLFSLTQTLKPKEWTPKISHQLYERLSSKKIYVTNLAKCTQSNARPLGNKLFREYLKLIEREILIIKPKNIVTFGNQVSSILLGKNITVSKYNGQSQKYALRNIVFNVYPVYYPVGQGIRNLNKAAKVITNILVRRNLLTTALEIV